MATQLAETGASRQAIQFHYDVGNEFYSLWLDATMTYSCGLWYADEDLATAQLNKIDWHLEHAGAGPGQRILDVGCGWGALLNRAVQRYGVREAIGLSLSAQQIKAIEAMASPGVEARLESWLEHKPATAYHGIVSVGAFEHFARLDQTPSEKLAGYRRFFEFCHDNLNPGGRLSLQTIVYQNATKKDFSPFFAQHVFPESDLPHIEEILSASKDFFEVETLRNDRHHYARTARAWRAGLRSNREKALALVGSEKVASYDKFLALLVVAFHTGAMNLTRIAFRHIPTH